MSEIIDYNDEKENGSCNTGCFGCIFFIIGVIIFVWIITRLPQVIKFIFNGLDNLIS